jgi:subtilisin family serine protease
MIEAAKIGSRYCHRSILLLIAASIITQFTYGANQTIKGIQYTKLSGVWHSVEPEGFNYPVDTSVLIVRMTNKGNVSSYNFAALGLPQLTVVVGRYLDGFYGIAVPADSNSFSVAHTIENSGDFDVVYFRVGGEALSTPNDPRYPPTINDTTFYHWNLRTMDMPHAWDITTGSSSVVVGLFDTGTDYDHPDLIGSKAPTVGWDFVDNDATPNGADSAKHGTFMMSIIGARTNNAYQCAGVAGGWDTTKGVSIMTFRTAVWDPIYKRDAAKSTDYWARAIDTVWRIWHPQVMNISYALGARPDLRLAIKHAVDSSDCVIVASSGNMGGDACAADESCSVQVTYPASDSMTIAVGGSYKTDVRWHTGGYDGSSYGPQLDVLAPANPVPATINRIWLGLPSNLYYRDVTGTSAAAAEVSGQVALIRTVNPSLNWRQVRDVVIRSTDKLAEMNDSNFTERDGYGRINVYKSLKAAIPVRYVGNASVATPTSVPGGTISNTFMILKNPDSTAYNDFAYAQLAGNLTLVKTPMVIEKRVRLKTGTFRLDTTKIIAEPQGEILPEAGGTIVLGSTNMIFHGPGSCIGASGGTVRISDGATFRVNNGGVLASFSPSTIELGANSTVIIDSVGKLKWNANTTWVFGANSKLKIYGTVDVAASVTLSLPSTSNVEVYPSAAFVMGAGSRIDVYGIVNVTDSTTMAIPSTGKLYAFAGSQFTFGAGAKLSMNGPIDAQGTLGSPISFTSSKPSPAAGDWYGVVMSSGPNTIKYCNLRYASQGFVILNNAGTTIENGEITNCSVQGVYEVGAVSYGALRIKGTKIKHNSLDGVVVADSWLSIESSAAIDSNSRYGVNVSSSGVRLDHAYIRNNSSDGIHVTGASSSVYLAKDLISQGNNQVTDNSGWQIQNVSPATTFVGHKYTSCDCLTIGVKEPPKISSVCNSPCSWQTHEVGGYNTIYGGTYWVKNTASSTLYADLTDWGSCDNWPSGALDGNISAAYPINCESLERSEPPIGDDLSVKKSDQDAREVSAFNANLTMKLVREYVQYLKAYLLSQPDSADHVIPILAGLVGEVGEYRQQLGDGWETYLSSVESTTPSLRLRKQAAVFRIQERLNKGDFSGVVAITGNMLQHALSDEMWFYCESRRIAALAMSGSLESAWQEFSAIRLKATTVDPDEMEALEKMMAMHGYRNFNGGSSEWPMAPTKPVLAQSAAPSVYELSQNYPNPVNPATEIQYGIPEGTHVYIRVYNLLGQQVATLVDEMQPAGYHSAQFDARSLPSGIYFYRMQAGNYSAVKKLMLLR